MTYGQRLETNFDIYGNQYISVKNWGFIVCLSLIILVNVSVYSWFFILVLYHIGQNFPF